MQKLIRNNSLVPRINLNHKPLPGWKLSGNKEVYVDSSGLNDLMYVGREREYNNGKYVGLTRTFRDAPKVPFDPDDWLEDFGDWIEIINPSAYAESTSQFLVVNAWDAAAFTPCFIQLSAHQHEDLLELFKVYAKELPVEMNQWFPELKLVKSNSGKKTLCFVRGDEYKSIEGAGPISDGLTPSWTQLSAEFAQFFNPNHGKLDEEEKHASARWIVWTIQSREMRRLQVAGAIDNIDPSVEKLHRKLIGNGHSNFPNGVDGMSASILAVAVSILHRRPIEVGNIAKVLNSSDPLNALLSSELGGKSRMKSVAAAVSKRRSQLSSLRFNYSAGQPVRG